MQYNDQNWNAKSGTMRKRSAASQRQAVESLVAVANTSVQKTEVVAKASDRLSQTALRHDNAARTKIMSYLKTQNQHRATISQVAESTALPTDQLADVLLSAKVDGLVKLIKVSGEIEAVLVEGR
jgi:predicted Rossmann fold nucleotide-binding protein DprA/Smf involved in DNA uptake